MTENQLTPERLGRGLGLHRVQQETDGVTLSSEDQKVLGDIQEHLQKMGAASKIGSALTTADFAKCGVNRSCLEDDPAVLIDVFVNETPASERERFLKHLNNCYECSTIFAETLRGCQRGYDDYIGK